jgi:hypothetical protein
MFSHFQANHIPLGFVNLKKKIVHIFSMVHGKMEPPNFHFKRIEKMVFKPGVQAWCSSLVFKPGVQAKLWIF